VQHINGQKGGFVVVGRNMREVENREGQLSFLVFTSWLVLLGAAFVTKALAQYFD